LTGVKEGGIIRKSRLKAANQRKVKGGAKLDVGSDNFMLQIVAA
jgi:hypothetical protein